MHRTCVRAYSTESRRDFAKSPSPTVQTVKDTWWTPQKRRIWLERLGRKLNFKHLEDWYSVSTDIIAKNSGIRLLDLHNGSPFELITSSFPEHEWKPWKFANVPRGFWSDPINQK